MIQAEAKHAIMILEAKLKNTTQQLETAENREKEASIVAESAKQEAANVLENMHKKIASHCEKLRKELSSLHGMEISRYKSELELANRGNERLSTQLEEANLSVTAQIDNFNRKIKDAENKIAESDHKLQNTLAELRGEVNRCDKLKAELDKVRF